MSDSSEKYFVQSPTRIDLAGGTLDCWPINAILSPVTTINIAINIFTHCEIKPREDQKIHIKAPGTGVDQWYDNFDDLAECPDVDVQFFKEHIVFWAPDQGFEITVDSQSPVGGGLGGSSSLSVSIFKAFNMWLNGQISQEDGVTLCSGIESKILQMPTGSQDYIPAYRGGMNIIDYLAGVPSVIQVDAKDIPFSENLSLFYTGKSHHSGINNWKVLQKFVNGDEVTRQSLTAIKEIAHDVRGALLSEDFESLPSLFKAEYQARTALAEEFSSPEIRKISQISDENGGLATKICGAGGGGCVFVWSDPEKKQSIIKACSDAGFKHLDVEFV